MSEIFISYSGKDEKNQKYKEDKNKALQIAKALKKENWDVFIDADLPGSSVWKPYIFDKKLREAQCLIAIIGEKYFSHWMDEEISQFMEYEKKRIENNNHANPYIYKMIPVYIKKLEERPPGFLKYNDLNFFDWDGSTTSKFWKDLTSKLKEYLQPNNTHSGFLPELSNEAPIELAQKNSRLERAKAISNIYEQHKVELRIQEKARKFVDNLSDQ